MQCRSVLLIIIFCNCCVFSFAQPQPKHNLSFDSLAKRWDDGMPLGNGWLGALVWQKGDKLRLSLDRVDLWDDRDMSGIDALKFSWVTAQVNKQQYDTVQKVGDEPYEAFAAPTKIPGAAIEFDLNKIGKVVSNELDISKAINTVKFSNGIVFNNYIHAVDEAGYFGFENLPAGEVFIPEMIIPNYNTGRVGTTGNSVEGIGLEKLGYPKGSVTKKQNSILYHQPTYKNNYYEVLVEWKLTKNKMIGQWTISFNKPAKLPALDLSKPEPTAWPSHEKWWSNFWNRSSVTLPDAQLDKQYYLEMYKFGAVARTNTPPISLQAIWTADNGNLPPWKGDFHHDLNTQLSYWPGYTANHLELTASYTNWLWKVKAQNKKWTKNYFGVDGLNVPGVTTISGKEMGGWIQYSMSPTTVAWLVQHFYWQWKYSKDKNFLQTRLYPYVHDAAVFAENITFLKDGKRMLPLSSSPEYHDNSIKAWFKDYTNYDLALYKFLFTTAAEIAGQMNKPSELTHWKSLADQLPAFDTNETGLTIAPGQNLDESHRHHAQLMAIYPLELLSVNNAGDNSIMKNSLRHAEKMGTRAWCGYSFSWMANVYAQTKEADKAVEQLKIFASNFCSVNSFHLNGDQKGGQYSSFTYRPFTLEGNFAFAQGVHELLLQSDNGVIEIFPAVPNNWQTVSFKNLRAKDAFIVSAQKDGQVTEVTITAEQGGKLKMKLPFKTFFIANSSKKYTLADGIIEINMNKGETVIIKNGYE